MNKLQRIEEMEKQLAALKAEIETESESMFPVINDGDNYCIMDNGFKVVSYTNDNDYYDRKFVSNANAFTDEKQAQACADYLKDRFWFIRKAIEFADGYEFADGGDNYSPVFDYNINEWILAYNSTCDGSAIYMNGDSGTEFKKWLNKHKPNGWG